jgi:hypothetical protein
MIPGGLSLSGRSSNNSGNVLYSCLRRGSTDLYVYGRRVRWCNDDALLIDAGRPMALSAIPIRTWSALTTAVGEHKKGVLRWTSKHVFPLVLGAYGLFLIPVFLAAEEDANTYDGNSNKNENWILAMMYPLAAIIFAVGMVVVRLLLDRYLEETFHPAVRLVTRSSTWSIALACCCFSSVGTNPCFDSFPSTMPRMMLPPAVVVSAASSCRIFGGACKIVNPPALLFFRGVIDSGGLLLGIGLPANLFQKSVPSSNDLDRIC